MNRPELESFQEAWQVFLYSIWSMLYYFGHMAKRNAHRYVHLVWFVGFAIAYNAAGIALLAWAAWVVPVVYALLWIFWLRRVFEAREIVKTVKL